MNALVSIIIPVYNTEKYLDRCFNSIINQTYKNLEIIFINDGSTDNSLSKLENYKNNYKNVIVINQENKGQSVARNIGLQKMTGEYFMFVDSDDYIHHTIIANMVDNIIKYEKDIVLCNLIKIYSNEVKIIKLNCNESSKNADIIKEGLIKNIIQGPCAKLYNRRVKCDMKFPENMIYEDQYVMVDVVTKYDLFYINTDGYYYDLTNLESTTHKVDNNSRMSDLIIALERNKKIINERLPMLNGCMEYSLYINYKNICNRCIEYSDYNYCYFKSVKNLRMLKLFNIIKYSSNIKNIFLFILIKYFTNIYILLIKIILFKYKKNSK